MSKPKIKYVNPEELSTLRMSCGNEKKYSVVVDWVPMRKRWVGIGWVTEDEATPGDIKKYPMVRRTLK
jgi:hypothetical protein